MLYLLLLGAVLPRRPRIPREPPQAESVAMVFEAPSASRTAPSLAETPAAPSRPEVRLPPSFSPPPATPAWPSFAPPAPSPSPRPMRRAAPRSPFGAPMDYSFGGGGAPPRASRRAGLSTRFTVPAPAARQGGDDAASGGFNARQVSGPKLDRDWFGQLAAWWREHRYYPEQAAMQGEDGTVALLLRVAPSGQVLRAEVVTRSGSTWLDAGALSVFRDARLPAFPPGAEGGAAEVRLSILYLLR